MSEETLTDQLQKLVAMLPDGAKSREHLGNCDTAKYQQTHNHSMGGVPD